MAADGDRGQARIGAGAPREYIAQPVDLDAAARRRRPTSRNRPISAERSRLAHKRSGLISRTLATTRELPFFAAAYRTMTVYRWKIMRHPESFRLCQSSSGRERQVAITKPIG